ncbi:MAG TPA: hypothetical protein VGV41_05745 [Pseudolabrys sp.]|jgi:hypothetical protein|uniref:hypothetical protein n=1 Tax=Pseudolabrys sp. TaxID=1960880 RepID=UPI002DDCEC53|nr:hypothetical protein [Pseudolabrys sp.]HEV2628127.1 hypothetical protein [Pseudolabrys sp.]
MTTLILRPSQARFASPFAVFGRFLTVLRAVIDVIADALVRARAATERYPLAA